MNPTNLSVLGSGWRTPLAIDRQGSIALSSENDNIQEAIWIILSTAPGERLMHPNFGCAIHRLAFEPNNVSTAGLARFYVEDALRTWEPRILLDEVEVQADVDQPWLLLISVRYRVRTTDSRFNLVYPFYLTRAVSA